MRFKPVIAVALAGALGAVSCSQPSKSRSTLSAADSPTGHAAQLRDRAALESRRLTPRDVPVPPGVGEASLRPREESDLRAAVPLQQALEVLEWKAASPEKDPAPAGAADQQRMREAQLLLESARQAMSEKRTLVALSNLRRAHELNPADVEIIRELARSFAAIPNPNSAAEFYTKLLVQDQGDGEAALALAIASASRRQFEESAAILARHFLLAASTGRQPFAHDPGGPVMGDYLLWFSLQNLGYDRAAIEVGRGVASLARAPTDQSMYADRLAIIYRQRGEIWRGIGDAHCRLREPLQALDAYGAASALPSTDPQSLTARLIYANLSAGRVLDAQRALLDSITAPGETDRLRLVGLCTYLAEHGQPTDLVAGAIEDLYRADPENELLAGAAAALLPPARAVGLLREFVARRHDDDGAVRQLLSWLVSRDPAAAASLIHAMAVKDPARLSKLAKQLAWATTDIKVTLDAVRSLPATPQRDVILARLLHGWRNDGAAWSLLTVSSLAAYPPALRLRMDLALALQEPQLLRDAVAQARLSDDPGLWGHAARATLAAGEASLAQALAEEAVQRWPEDEEALIALAAVAVAQASRPGPLAPSASAGQAPTEAEQRRAMAQSAIDIIDRVLVKSPANEQAHHLALSVYASDGPAADQELFKQAARRLAEAGSGSRLLMQWNIAQELATGRFESALERTLTMHATVPSEPEVLKLAVAAWRGLDRERDAVAWLQQQLDEHPLDPTLLEMWVDRKLEGGQSSEVLPRLRELVAAQPDHHSARWMLEKAARAAQLADEALALGEARLAARPLGVRRELEFAAMLAGAGRVDDAVPHLEWIIEHPAEGSLEYLVSTMAVLRRVEESLPRALDMQIALASQCAAAFPQTPVAMYSAALESLAKLDRVDSAFDQLVRDAVARAPGAADVGREGASIWRQVAQQLIDAGHPAVAARVLRVRLDMQPQITGRFYGALSLAAFACDAASGDAEIAVSNLRRIIDAGRLPALASVIPSLVSEPESYFQVSMMFSIAGQEEGAGRILRHVVAADPDHVMALNNLGYMKLDEVQLEGDAQRMIERAYELDERNDNVIDTLGWMRYRQGQLEDQGGREGAITLLQRAVSMNQEPEAEVIEHLGDALWRAGRRDEAKQAWDRAAGILENRSFRDKQLEFMQLLQSQMWSVVVVDPEDRYDRTYGPVLKRLRDKISAADRGQEPPIAPLFGELAVESPNP